MTDAGCVCACTPPVQLGFKFYIDDEALDREDSPVVTELRRGGGASKEGGDKEGGDSELTGILMMNRMREV